MAKSKTKILPSRPKEAVPSTVTIPLADVITRVRAGESFSSLHEQRMSKADWKIYQTMTPEDQSSVDNAVGQLRTKMANPKNNLILEKIRADIFRKYAEQD